MTVVGGVQLGEGGPGQEGCKRYEKVVELEIPMGSKNYNQNTGGMTRRSGDVGQSAIHNI